MVYYRPLAMRLERVNHGTQICCLLRIATYNRHCSLSNGSLEFGRKGVSTKFCQAGIMTISNLRLAVLISALLTFTIGYKHPTPFYVTDKDHVLFISIVSSLVVLGLTLVTLPRLRQQRLKLL